MESLDGAARHQSCMVRPMLPDGAVFVLPKCPINTATSGRPVRPIVADDLLLSEPKKERGTTEVEEQQASEEQTTGPALVAPDVILETTPPTPPMPPERKRLPNGETSAAAEQNTTSRPAAASFSRDCVYVPGKGYRVKAESIPGVAWYRHWRQIRDRGLPYGKDGYFIRELPSEFPPPVDNGEQPVDNFSGRTTGSR